jgi:hypothetical protein
VAAVSPGLVREHGDHRDWNFQRIR